MYISDLFYLLRGTDNFNHADDMTIHVCDSNLEDVPNRFHENCMKLNDDKCHLLAFGKKINDVSVTVRNL